MDNHNTPENVLREWATSILLIYNKWKEEGRTPQKNNNNFFEAIEQIFTEEKLGEDGWKLYEFRQKITPVCQKLQPHTKSEHPHLSKEEETEMVIGWLHEQTGVEDINEACEIMSDTVGEAYLQQFFPSFKKKS